MAENLDLVLMHYAVRNKKFLLELSKTIKPEYFNGIYADLYGLLYSGINNPTIKDVLGLPAILDYCDRNNLQHKRESIRQIYTDAANLQLNNATPVEADFGYFVSTVKERYNAAVLRNAISKMNQMLTPGIPVADVNSILTETVSEVQSINRTSIFDEGSLGDDIINIFKEYEAVATSPEQFKGVSSGFASLDALTNGFFPGELILIGGQEGSGKSMLAMNMAVSAWMGSNTIDNAGPDFCNDGKNVVYFSLEMPRSNRGEISSAANLNKRIVSCLANIPNTEFRRGALENEDKVRLSKACKFIKKYDAQKKLYVIDMPRGATIHDIETKIIELREKFSIDLLVVDYIGLMAGAEDEDDFEAQGKLSEGLHELARVYRIPVISPVQLNRPGTANHSMSNQKYNNTRISRSARIGQNANIVLIIEYRDNERDLTDMPIHITKMRDAGGSKLLFMKDFARMRITDAMTMEVADAGQFVDLGDNTDD